MTTTLDDADIEGLARACARRFPGSEGQRPFAEAVGLGADRTDVGDDVAGWSSLIRAAQARGQLTQLARALNRAAPGDENLVALSRALGVVAAPPPTRFPAAMLGAVGVVLVLGAGVAWLAGGDEPTSASVPSPGAPGASASSASPVAATAATDVAAATPTEVAPPEPAAPAEVAPPEPAAPAEVAPPASAPAKPDPVAAAAPAAPAGKSRVGCPGPAGQVVGYYYAGTTSPGAVGTTVTLSRDARVRAEYPSAANGHDAKTAERCVLPRGTQLTLVQAPIDASNGHYWVPVVAP